MKKLDTEIIIIGAGVIGLAISYYFSKAGKKVVLLESENNFGTGSSSRNTEVIHAGIYYKKNSLKSKLCFKGKSLIYEFCEKYSVRHKKIGKLFIAISSEEIESLEKIKLQAELNGLLDLKFIKKNVLKNLEPELKCEAAVLSPSSGIVDSYSLMESLLRLSQDNGIIFSPNSPFLDAKFKSGYWEVYIGGKEPVKLSSKIVINAAGLNAINISHIVKTNKRIPLPNPTKGLYLRYSGKSPVNHIIYPALIPGQIKERADATPDLNNSLRFGPSVEKEENLQTNDFTVNPNIKKRFLPLIKKYLPNIDEQKINLDIAGIRPKVKEENVSITDFIFEWGVEKGWLDLWNIESPGLTSSLAIGEYVFDKVKKSQIL
jgi:L-2-hydroxyglutarate oxidase LhgO